MQRARGYECDDNYEHLEYNVASPDEKALIEACASFGIKFIGEEETEYCLVCRVLETRDDNQTVFKEYKKLKVLEFDSTRLANVSDCSVSLWKTHAGDKRCGEQCPTKMCHRAH